MMDRFFVWLHRRTANALRIRAGQGGNDATSALVEIEAFDRHDAYTQLGKDPYGMDATKFFALRKVENGYVLITRKYVSKTGPGVNPNNGTPGPPFIEQMYIMPDTSEIMTQLGAILVKERIL